MKKMLFRRQDLRKWKGPERIPFWICVIAVIANIGEWGFDQTTLVGTILTSTYLLTLVVVLFSIATRYFVSKMKLGIAIRVFDALLVLLILLSMAGMISGWSGEKPAGVDSLTSFTLLAALLREFSVMQLELKRLSINPAQLFLISFSVIILVGTFLLLLPNATHAGISFIDALFTSTSAVCVTGLIVVDTGSHFTSFGQASILLMIQAGGIGIMTYISYFSYFFKGGASYENQVYLQGLTNSKKIGEVFAVLRKIILITFLVEATGALLIFLSVDVAHFSSPMEQVFFSVFHSVSAFCNAGFSTLENSLYQTGFRFNYPLHLVVTVLFIIGGIGFPIVFNFIQYIKYFFFNRLFSRRPNYAPWMININTRIVLVTTAVLLAAGTLVFYVLEYNNTLAEHSGLGKIVAAFFGAATPRTAGFNSVDTSALSLPMIILVLLLMWIGASPGSTGGGIKTSTFAIAVMNMASLARGRNRIEVYQREVSNASVRRAFSIISLSVIVIGLCTFLITLFDKDKGLLAVAFESVSAFSTVGLSLGITGDLSTASKVVVIVTMFVGRVSMLTVLAALLRQARFTKYRYPTEDILIN